MNRLLLEWCCGPESLFGMPSAESKGCNVVRLTEREDMTTEYGFKFAQMAVEQTPVDTLSIIWSALPCTGGSPWQNINRRQPGGMARLRKHWGLFDKLLLKFAKCVDWLAKGPRRWTICVEWPRSCSYWRKPEVIDFVRKWKLHEVTFHGCALGVMTRSGLLMMKPWRVCTKKSERR